MATAVSQIQTNDGYVTTTWNLAQSQTGDSTNTGRFSSPKTIQISGTFGGGTIAIQGSLDGTIWDTMSILDLQSGSYVLLTGIAAAQFAALIENPRFIRAVVSGGDGTTALKVVIGSPSLD